MTLIAAFRCYEGAVLCADQQETVGDIRVAVNKIKPEICGQYQLAIAGSGNADLIDGFADRLARRVRKWPGKCDEEFATESIRDLLLEFHSNEVALYPSDSATDKLSDFLICIKPVDAPDVFLWESHGSAIAPVGDYALLGIGAAIYRHELQKLYQPRALRQQVILLGIHLFSLAKETSNYVGGNTDIIIATDRGIAPLDGEIVRQLAGHMAAFNAMIAELVLACPNSAIPDVELEGQLDNFKEAVMQLRNYYRSLPSVAI